MKIKAIRTSAYSPHRRREVDITAGLQVTPRGTFFYIEEGGVTGYESFYLEDALISDLCARGWSACAGTEGRWDSMFISGAEMRRALEALGVI